MKPNRTYSSQPYPLWAVVTETEALWIGLVIGWVVYGANDGDEQIEAYPVVNRLNCNSCNAYELNDWASLYMTLEDAQLATVEASRV